MDTSRVIVFSPADAFLFELSPSEVFARVRTEEVNGEHSLEITTTRVLEREQRVLTVDASGRWREYVVMGIDEAHAGGDRPLGTYWCTWSLQHDLAVTYVTAMPGTQGAVGARTALEAALGGTDRWQAGTVTVGTTGGASMYYMSGYEALGVVVETWGGEIDATITVNSTTCTVLSRAVDLYEMQGNQEARRRFDYSRDMRSIRRRVEETPVCCRIVPRGKGEQTDAGGYGRKIDIKEVNDGLEYLQDDESAAAFQLPSGNGVEYPTLVIENSKCETPADLKAWAQSVMHEYTRPKVTYEADVVQLSQAGMDVYSMALGDAVQCVDRGFCEDGLRIEGRVKRIVANEVDTTDVRVTIGDLKGGVAKLIGGISVGIGKVEDQLRYMTTAGYLNDLLDRLNAEINAIDGYAYIIPGYGIITYNRAVADPLVGNEADYVTQIKGGSIRIASEKNSPFAGINDWKWRTVFQSGLVATDVLTATNVVTGVIEDAAHKLNPANGNYWDLDDGEFRMSAGVTFGGDTVAEIAAAEVGDFVAGDYADDMADMQDYADGVGTAVKNFFTQGEILTRLLGGSDGLATDGNGHLYMKGTFVKAVGLDAQYITTGVLTDQQGRNSWNLDTGVMNLSTSLTVGGANNANGTITVKDTNGDSLTVIDKDGITLAMNGYKAGSKHYSKMGQFTYYTDYGEQVTGRGLVLYATGEQATSGNQSSSKLMLSGCEQQANGLSTGKAVIVCPDTLHIYGNAGAGYRNIGAVTLGSTLVLETSKLSDSGYGYDYRDSMSLEIGSQRITGKAMRNNGSAPDWLSVTSAHSNATTSVTLNVGAATVTGTKSRKVATENYGDRLLYSYETPSPMFGDIGSGAIGDDGVCVVCLDDVFAETANLEMDYQVFLQKRGQGDLWVSEKHPTHFTVEGTPGLAFDWEAKAHQAGYETLRAEEDDVEPALDEAVMDGIEGFDYGDYIAELERIYDDEIGAIND